jgi:hypothetical protein
MAGQKRPKNVIPQAQVVSVKAVQQLASSSLETISVPATATAPYASSTTSGATSTTFDILDQIRINSLGVANDAGIFAGKDKTDGFYNLNFKSFAVTDDLELTQTPTTITLGLKQSDVQPTYIQSGINLNQTGGRVYNGVDGSSLTFRSITVGNNLTIQQSADTIEIGLAFSPTTGDISGATNLGVDGVGIGVFKNKVDGNLNFRRLISSNNLLSLSQDSADNQIVMTLNESAFNLNNLGGVLPTTKIAGLHPIATNPDYNLLTNKPVIPTRLSDLSDITGTPTTGQVLRYVQGSGWMPTNESGGSNAFGTVKVGSNTIAANSINADITFSPGSELVVEGDILTRKVTYNLKPTGVTAGTYSNANVQVDQYGRVIGIQNGIASPANPFIDPTTTLGDMIIRTATGSTRLPIGQTDQVLTVGANGLPQWRTGGSSAPGTVTSVGVLGDGAVQVTGNTITTSGSFTVALKPTGITAGNYTNPAITVDRWGRITAIASGGSGSSGGSSVQVKSGYGLSGGGPLTSDVTLSLAMTGITAGEYSNPKIKVDAYGRILDITAGAAGSGGGLTSVGIIANGGINVTGSPLTSNGNITLTLTNTGVTPGQYGLANYTVNAQGRITAVSTTGQVTLNGSLMSPQSEPIIDAAGGIYFPGYTAAEIGNKNHPVNTQNKGLGKAILNITNYQLMFATEEDPTSPWAQLGGTVLITPA